MAEQDVILNWDPIRRLASASMLGTYQAVGTPLSNAARVLIVCNNTNQLVTFSIDGINDNIDFVAGATMILDIASNKQLAAALWQKALVQPSAKGTAGTGNFCVTVLY